MTLDAALFFLGGSDQANGRWAIEFDAPQRLCLLSSYHAWQDIVFKDRADRPANLAEIFERQSASTGTRVHLGGRSEPDAYQVCVPMLRRQWILDIRPLRIASGGGALPQRKLSAWI